MPVDQHDIVELLCTLAEEEKLRVTVKESLKGGLIAGAAAVVGGVLLGPLGLAVGGAAGGCVAFLLTKGKFLPAVEVIATMQPEKRDALAGKVLQIMASIEVIDIAVFAAIVSGDLSIRQRVLETLIDHLKNEMSMSIVDHV